MEFSAGHIKGILSPSRYSNRRTRQNSKGIIEFHFQLDLISDTAVREIEPVMVKKYPFRLPCPER